MIRSYSKAARSRISFVFSYPHLRRAMIAAGSFLVFVVVAVDVFWELIRDRCEVG